MKKVQPISKQEIMDDSFEDIMKNSFDKIANRCNYIINKIIYAYGLEDVLYADLKKEVIETFITCFFRDEDDEEIKWCENYEENWEEDHEEDGSENEEGWEYYEEDGWYGYLPFMTSRTKEYNKNKILQFFNSIPVSNQRPGSINKFEFNDKTYYCFRKINLNNDGKRVAGVIPRDFLFIDFEELEPFKTMLERRKKRETCSNEITKKELKQALDYINEKFGDIMQKLEDE